MHSIKKFVFEFLSRSLRTIDVDLKRCCIPVIAHACGAICN